MKILNPKQKSHLNKKINRETTKKSSFFIKNSIKDEPLLHNHKPQMEIICQQKKPLNNQKNFGFHQKPHKR